MVRLTFHEAGICFCLEQCVKNRYSILWKHSDIFFKIMFGILSGPGVLLLARFSYISRMFLCLSIHVMVFADFLFCR